MVFVLWRLCLLFERMDGYCVVAEWLSGHE